jgi:hypothetical protein
MAVNIDTDMDLDHTEKDSTTQPATEAPGEEKKEGDGGWAAYKVCKRNITDKGYYTGLTL